MSGNQLYHDITDIMRFLFEKEDKDLTKREMAIVTRHTQLGGSPDGFRYLGSIYSALAGATRQRGRYDRLSPTLVPEMDGIHTDRKILEVDCSRIKQALVLVLVGVSSFQDMRDALPNCLQDSIPECKGLARTRDEAYTLLDNRRAYSQYMQLREKIEFYVATRLIY